MRLSHSELSALADVECELPASVVYWTRRITPYVMGATLVTSAISGAFVLMVVLFDDRAHVSTCPQEAFRLSAVEYELQRRSCEAVEHGSTLPR